MFSFLRGLSVELTNHCDRNCWYCHGRKQARTLGFIDEPLFNSILKEIKPYLFPYRLGLNFNGDSLLHPKFKSFFTKALKSGKIIRINTNRLDLFLLRKLMEKRFNWVVSLHDESDSSLYTWDVTRQRVNKETIIPRDLHTGRKHSKRCSWPFRYMSVLWNGDVNLCCHDLEGLNVIGNMKGKGVYDFWRGREYREVRRRVKKFGKPDLPLCRNCDLY